MVLNMVKTYVETGCRPSRFVKVMFIGTVLETGVYQPKRSREAPVLGKGAWLGTGGPSPGVTTRRGHNATRKMQKSCILALLQIWPFNCAVFTTNRPFKPDNKYIIIIIVVVVVVVVCFIYHCDSDKNITVSYHIGDIRMFLGHKL